MNVFNRLLGLLLAVFLLGSGIAAIQGGLFGVPQPLQDRVPELAGHALWLIPGGAVALLAGLVLGVMELRVPRRGTHLLLREDKLGTVSVSMQGLRRLAEHVIGEIPGIEAVSSEARRTRNGVVFHCRLAVKPDSSTPDLANEIRARLGSAVLYHIGQPAAQIHIHTQVDSGALVRRRVR